MSVVKNKSALASRIKSWFNFEIIMGFGVMDKTNLAETGTTHGLLDKVKTGLTCRRRSIGDIGTAGHDRFKWEAALGAGNGDKSLETTVSKPGGEIGDKALYVGGWGANLNGAAFQRLTEIKLHARHQTTLVRVAHHGL